MDVFVKSSKKFEPGFNIATILSRKATAGQIGIEVEVEGNKFPKPEGMAGTHHPVPFPDLPIWSYVHDGSLRGKDNAEYVLTKPLMFSEVSDAVSALWEKLKGYGSVLDESNRTSVHVHLNCQEFHLNRLTAFMALYFTFEEVLTQWCGEHRVGNLFCLRAKDAPAIISQIKRFIKTDGKYELRDHLHYAGLNANALFKHGSLEIRSLRGCSNPETIIEWVEILERLYHLSKEFPDPRDVCSRFSAGGPMAFFDDMLGPKAHVVRSGVSFDEDRIRDSMYEGIRLAQDLCYCRDWSIFQTIDMKEDPFGRSSKTVMKKLAASLGASPEMTLAQAHAILDDEDDFEPDEDLDTAMDEMGVPEPVQFAIPQPTPMPLTGTSLLNSITTPSNPPLGWPDTNF